MKKEVIIVGKTKAGSKLCIGALTRDGESLRLQQEDFPFWEESDGFELLKCYSLEYAHRKNDRNPHHVEDAVVSNRKHTGMCGSAELLALLESLGLVSNATEAAEAFKYTGTSSPFVVNPTNGYVTANESEVIRLQNSVTFWRLPFDLWLDQRGNATYYVSNNGHLAIKFVGVANPIQSIKKGTIVRLSTAGLWKPDDDRGEKKSYLQLSGWFQ